MTKKYFLSLFILSILSNELYSSSNYSSTETAAHSNFSLLEQSRQSSSGNFSNTKESTAPNNKTIFPSACQLSTKNIPYWKKTVRNDYSPAINKAIRDKNLQLLKSRNSNLYPFDSETLSDISSDGLDKNYYDQSFLNHLLFEAAVHNKPFVSYLLMKHGANPNFKNSFGSMSPLEIAEKNQFERTKDVLSGKDLDDTYFQ